MSLLQAMCQIASTTAPVRWAKSQAWAVLCCSIVITTWAALAIEPTQLTMYGTLVLQAIPLLLLLIDNAGKALFPTVQPQSLLQRMFTRSISVLPPVPHASTRFSTCCISCPSNRLAAWLSEVMIQMRLLTGLLVQPRSALIMPLVSQ